MLHHFPRDDGVVASEPDEKTVHMGHTDDSGVVKTTHLPAVPYAECTVPNRLGIYVSARDTPNSLVSENDAKSMVLAFEAPVIAVVQQGIRKVMHDPGRLKDHDPPVGRFRMTWGLEPTVYQVTMLLFN